MVTTRRISMLIPRRLVFLDQMAQPVASVLATSYWSGVPFAFGPGQYVKYKVEPNLNAPSPTEAPADPTYLGADLKARLKTSDASFRFLVQLRTDEASMPLDDATVSWNSPFVHVADLLLPQQDIDNRGQAMYGENLAFNIWRVTAPHTPQGSLSEARRVVYVASAKQRHSANGVPDAEPSSPPLKLGRVPVVDTRIVRAAIHPSIGIARIGDSKSEFFVGRGHSSNCGPFRLL